MSEEPHLLVKEVIKILDDAGLYGMLSYFREIDHRLKLLNEIIEANNWYTEAELIGERVQVLLKDDH